MLHIMGNGELIEDGIPPVDHSKLGDFDLTIDSLEAISEKEKNDNIKTYS